MHRVKETKKTLLECYNSDEFDVILLPTSSTKPLSEYHVIKLLKHFDIDLEVIQKELGLPFNSLGEGSDHIIAAHHIGNREYRIPIKGDTKKEIWCWVTHFKIEDNIECSALKRFLSVQSESIKPRLGISKKAIAEWSILRNVFLNYGGFDVTLTDSEYESDWTHLEII